MNPKDPLIFIIDSNNTYRKIINTCLSALDYCNNAMFESGEECIEKSKKNPDLIILDYNLGENNMNGMDFAVHFQKHSPSTKFIFLSSNTSIDIAVSAIKWGAFDYIIKSKLGLDRLINRLGALMDSEKKFIKTEKLQKKILAAVGFCVAALIYGIYTYYNC